MKYFALILAAILGIAAPVSAAISITVTVQESVFPGAPTSGIARTSEPVQVGIPLPNDASTGATNISELSLSGVSEGQFRVLACWSGTLTATACTGGRIKWVQVNTRVSLSAGSTTTFTVTSGATGNFGGSNIATDNGSTISVATGAATFTFRKANFNGFHEVVVGSTTIVTTSSGSDGLVIMGPTWNNSTCTVGNCTTKYASVNDEDSTCSIEQNGPSMAVIKCEGGYDDSSNNEYMRFLVRFYIAKGQTNVKAVTTTKNDKLGASSSFASATKAMISEWRVNTNTGSGTHNFQISEHGGAVESGTLVGSEDVYQYIGKMEHMEEGSWDAQSPQYTTDTGYTIKRDAGTNTLGSGTTTQIPGGWADIRNGSGAGVLIGMYQTAGYWPKSLEFAAGGDDVRIGIWPRQNSRIVHQQWPQWNTHDLYFHFHDAALSSASDTFLKQQHFLLGRAPYTHYNTTAAFPVWKMIDPTAHDAYIANLCSTSPTAIPSGNCDYGDMGMSGKYTIYIYRSYSWGDGGQTNQLENRFAWMLNFIERGWAGRYLRAMHFYRFQTDDVFPHSDGFRWRDQTTDSYGYPTNITSTNDAEAQGPHIPDLNHAHFWGMAYYYLMTGDELVKDAIMDGYLDRFTSTGKYYTTSLIGQSTRTIGAAISGHIHLAHFMTDIGETSEAATLSGYAEDIYEQQVRGDGLCPESDAPYIPCTAPTYGYVNDPTFGTTLEWAINDGPYDGTSKLRGGHWGAGRVTTWCDEATIADEDIPLMGRGHTILNHGIMAQALVEARDYFGSGWQYYDESLDVAYGLALSSMTEAWYDDASRDLDVIGPRAYVLFDAANSCDPAADSSNYTPGARNGIWSLFYVRWLVEGSTTQWLTKWEDSMRLMFYEVGNQGILEGGGFSQTSVLEHILTPGTTPLQDVDISSVVDNGGGSYTVHWIVPEGAESYRIKWSPKQIRPNAYDTLNFDAHDTYTFGIDPAVWRPWFSAANAASVPAPGTAGTNQNITISTGISGLTAANFSIKAYCSGECVQAGTPTTITWVEQTNPSDVPHLMYFTDLKYNPVSEKVIGYLVRGAGSSIYASSIHEYETNANDWTDKGGSTPAGNDCSSHASASPLPWPGNRHPVGQMAIDTTRNKLHLMGGVCQGAVGSGWRDHWTYDLTTYTWTQLSAIETLSVPNVWSNMVYSAALDMIALFGDSQTWVYCPSATVNSTQIAAGCTTAQTWYQTTNIPVGFPGSQWTSGHKNSFFDDPTIGQAVFFAKAEFAGDREVWTYDYATKLFSERTGTTGIPTGAASTTAGDKDHVRVTTGPYAGTYLFHWTLPTSGSDCSGATADYLYNYATNAYTQITTNGTGPYCAVHLVWDEAAGKIVSWGKKTGSSEPGIWIGTLSGGDVQASSVISRIRLRR